MLQTWTERHKFNESRGSGELAAAYIIKSADLGEYFTAIGLVQRLWFNVMALPKKARASATQE